MSVPLVEHENAAPAGQQGMATTTTAASPSSTTGAGPSVDLEFGGRATDPVIQVGSVRLGYEDVLLLIALVQVSTTVARLYMEVSD